VKPILGLIVLLAWPCLGMGSRVEAGFALGRSAFILERSAGSLGVEFQLVLNGDEPAEPEETTTSAAGNETPPPSPRDTPRAPGRQVALPSGPGGASPGGSTAGSPPSGPGSGTGLTFILSSDFSVQGADPSGRLFLADERLKEPPFASRLFRPPRDV
jgi:hypothetical protein